MNAAPDIIAGAEYVNAITANESDRRYRQAFRGLALKLAPPGSSLFDFGSGPGLDARFYAEHGLKVSAYDVDARMCEYLAVHCGEFLATGGVTLYRGDYREFLTATEPRLAGSIDLVTSNFAPLNLVDNLPELFAKFASLTTPSGAVLAGVLSPYFVGDLRYGWWWRNVLRLGRDGRYSVPGAQGLIWRRRLQDFALQCAPHFALEQVFAGSETGLPARSPGAWLRLSACRFMFLLFRRLAGVDPPRADTRFSRPR